MGSEYLTKSKPSVVTLVSQISCAVQKQILYILVVVVCSFFPLILLFGTGFDRLLSCWVVAAIELEADKQ